MEFKHIAYLKRMARTKADDMRTFAGSMLSQHSFFQEFEEYVSIMCLLGEGDYMEEMNPEMFEIKADFIKLGHPTVFDPEKHSTYITCSVALANKFQRYTHNKFPEPKGWP